MPENPKQDRRQLRKYKHPHAASDTSRGRLRSLDDDNKRTDFQRDIHRITYSQPFRRLRHKTQVFYMPNNDHICTRLEHSIHVANAARTVARCLGLNEDLAEAIGLGHDLGHAPFGHHGEDVLTGICEKQQIAPCFHHEVHSLRVVDHLAQFDRNPEPGLNLTWEVRDGIVSHNGEDFKNDAARIVVPSAAGKALETIEQRYDAGNPSTLEGCIVRLVDKVAYAGRDLEDGIQAGLIRPQDVPSHIRDVLGNNNGDIVGSLITDIIETSSLSEPSIEMSKEKFDALRGLIKFNYDSIYETPRVVRYKAQVCIAMHHLFDHFVEVLSDTNRFANASAVAKLPKGRVYTTFERYCKEVPSVSESHERIVVDFIAGFTDNFFLSALDEVFIPHASDT